MKKIFNTSLISLIPVIFLLFPGFLSAGPVEVIDVDGLKVLLKTTSKDVISIRLVITGGTANYQSDKQGIESLALNMVIKGGTVSMNKTDFLTAAEKIGTTFRSDASFDCGEISMLCVKQFWEQSWKLFSDALVNPAFSEKEFSSQKEQFISRAKQNESDPDYSLNRLAVNFAFNGKNYGKNPDGTPESLASLTLDDLKSYYSDILCRKKAFIVVVGNINRDDLIQKIRSAFSKIPEGTAPKMEHDLIQKAGQTISVRKISTNYLCGLMSSVAWDAPDIAPMMVAMNIMYTKFFVELRTKRSLSYAPAAFIISEAVSSPYLELYITTDHPKEAIEQMTAIVNNVIKNGFTEEELVNSKNTYITRYLMRIESASSQSDNIALWQLKGNLAMFDNFEDKVNSVTLKDINRVFKSAAGKLRWAYLGDTSKISPEDFKQIEK